MRLALRILGLYLVPAALGFLVGRGLEWTPGQSAAFMWAMVLFTYWVAGWFEWRREGVLDTALGGALAIGVFLAIWIRSFLMEQPVYVSPRAVSMSLPVILVGPYLAQVIWTLLTARRD